MTAHKLSMADEAVITDFLAKNSRLEEEVEYLHNELASIRTGPHADLLKENRNLRHELAVLVHGIDAESERLREQLTASCAREAQLREALSILVDRIEYYSSLGEEGRTTIEQWEYTEGSSDMAKARETLAISHDDTALREYRRKVLLEAAEHCNKRGYGLMGHEISMMAEEE